MILYRKTARFQKRAIVDLQNYRSEWMHPVPLPENRVLHMHKSYIKDAEGDEIRYYLDEEKNYVVPKRKLEDVVQYL